MAKNFPCAVTLIINKLLTEGLYSNLVQAFTTGRKPDLVWQNGNLSWGTSGYILGNTAPEATTDISPALGATITLNTNMLQNSSQLLIAAAVIHETLHAYINYGLSTAQDNATNGLVDFTTSNFLLSIDNWCIIDGLPTNYSNHLVMMTSYFEQAVSMLKTWDNGAHPDSDYEMAMLYGLNTSDPKATATENNDLQTEYNALLTQYGLTATQISNFNINNLNAPASAKLPGGCN